MVVATIWFLATGNFSTAMQDNIYLYRPVLFGVMYIAAFSTRPAFCGKKQTEWCLTTTKCETTAWNDCKLMVQEPDIYNFNYWFDLSTVFYLYFVWWQVLTDFNDSVTFAFRDRPSRVVCLIGLHNRSFRRWFFPGRQSLALVLKLSSKQTGDMPKTKRTCWPHMSKACKIQKAQTKHKPAARSTKQ